MRSEIRSPTLFMENDPTQCATLHRLLEPPFAAARNGEKVASFLVFRVASTDGTNCGRARLNPAAEFTILWPRFFLLGERVNEQNFQKHFH